MPSVAKQWAVTTNGTFDFNNPTNWQFGIVPGILDAAAFNTNVNDTVTGNATIAELQIDLGLITLTGSYTLSGAQPTELSTGVDGGLIIAPGASVFWGRKHFGFRRTYRRRCSQRLQHGNIRSPRIFDPVARVYSRRGIDFPWCRRLHR